MALVLFSFPKRSDVIKFYEQGSKFLIYEKKFYLTIDLEEWYHLLYFKKYTNLKGKDFFIFKINEFLNFLNKDKLRLHFLYLPS